MFRRSPFTIGRRLFVEKRFLSTTVIRGSLEINKSLYEAVNQIVNGIGLPKSHFWTEFESAVKDFTPLNDSLLFRRDELQHDLDKYHKAHPNPAADLADYKSFLRGIGYLEPTPKDFQVTTTRVDPEISKLCGPQLVVPGNNVRMVLNAANARWGSLSAAFHDTDALFPTTDKDQQNRKKLAFAAVERVLDAIFPLTQGRHFKEVGGVSIVNGSLVFSMAGTSVMEPGMFEIGTIGLKDDTAFVGFTGPADSPTSVLLRHHGLHMELLVDDAGIKDVVVEAALSTIFDCEDSVAAVDGEDKAALYLTWAGLMRGNLEATLPNGEIRRLSSNKTFFTPENNELMLPGRSILLNRNVGLHMYTDAVKCNGEQIPEGILDAFVTAAAGALSIQVSPLPEHRNSRVGSIYLVKPKLQGSDEVRFTNALFDRVEDALKLHRNTIKVGIMDEERRTSLNLAACVAAASERLIFINTGFLDRCASEISSVGACGPVLGKEAQKSEPWFQAYEENNVAVGLSCGLPGKGQIGKGMWSAPDEMRKMLATKAAHPAAGASTAWVPSPTSAVLHSLHYHEVDVDASRQGLLAAAARRGLPHQDAERHLDALLTPPLALAGTNALEPSAVSAEVDELVHAMLGYVVRWVDMGVGCSKVVDLKSVGQMEDRATLRLSSQILVNWLKHGVITEKEVRHAFYNMTLVVDSQNVADPRYVAMEPDPESNSPAYNAALDLVLHGHEVPGGYTEPYLNYRRRQVKAEGPRFATGRSGVIYSL